MGTGQAADPLTVSLSAAAACLAAACCSGAMDS